MRFDTVLYVFRELGILKLWTHYFFAFSWIFEGDSDQLANDFPPLRGFGAHACPQPWKSELSLNSLLIRKVISLTHKIDPKVNRWRPVVGRVGRTGPGRGCPIRTPPSCRTAGSIPDSRSDLRWRPRCRRGTSQCPGFARGRTRVGVSQVSWVLGFMLLGYVSLNIDNE